MGVLTVTVVKATGLADEDLIGKTDPYVKLSLEQDNFVFDKDYGYQQTTVKEGDVNPVWDETFTFNVPTLDNMVLTLQAYDSDVGSGDDKCGKCKIKLEDEEISSSPTRLVKCIDFNLLRANGEITVDVSYEEE
mmetsp:Transcript_2142/g.4593  ORF Transcript_2142/g.4593 Transcript_2142/m.4593 type:complete len:134 (-) Transcript_2142:282-683(-)|eukprot:CAMPEP_0168176670 /NCGR_PEP_ID=MMETSP0139_2-20121125/7931_1 /TAXON_ID=44445 /ORGANISM="Pseudo-nitzschia australis, Strain 10249 10 AB" /LENGTH=133 /DNA_ID=CAMNT_0008095443 /DNA_START=135 /DNA_END=536 /DNA_ORIENTATION=+